MPTTPRPSPRTGIQLGRLFLHMVTIAYGKKYCTEPPAVAVDCLRASERPRLGCIAGAPGSLVGTSSVRGGGVDLGVRAETRPSSNGGARRRQPADGGGTGRP